jgi:hypothetical protein
MGEHPALIRLSDVQRREVVYLDGAATIPRGMLSLVAGHPGLGKSLWVDWLAGEVTRRDRAVVLCSAEDSLEYTIKARMQAVNARTDLVHALVPKTPDGYPRGVTFPADADLLLDVVRAVDAALVVIDPIGAHIGQGIDSHKDASLRQALAPLARVAEDTLAAVIAVYHLNKSTGSDPMMRLNGSIGGPGQARSALLLDRDPDDPEKERGPRRVLAHFKSNIGPLQPSQRFQVEAVTLPAANLEPEVMTARLVPLGESAYSVRGLLAANGDVGEERSQTGDAVDLLRAELADGRRRAVELFAAAKDADVSPKALRRARERLDITPKKDGFDGGWYWELPEPTRCPQDAPSRGGASWASSETEGHLRGGEAAAA